MLQISILSRQPYIVKLRSENNNRKWIKPIFIPTLLLGSTNLGKVVNEHLVFLCSNHPLM